MRGRGRRRIHSEYNEIYFKPQGIPLRDLLEVSLTAEDLETLRLRYMEGLSQNEAADKMDISQSQYQRDLLSVHKKITDALINGKAIKVSK